MPLADATLVWTAIGSAATVAGLVAAIVIAAVSARSMAASQRMLLERLAELEEPIRRSRGLREQLESEPGAQAATANQIASELVALAAEARRLTQLADSETDVAALAAEARRLQEMADTARAFLATDSDASVRRSLDDKLRTQASDEADAFRRSLDAVLRAQASDEADAFRRSRDAILAALASDLDTRLATRRRNAMVGVALVVTSAGVYILLWLLLQHFPHH